MLTGGLERSLDSLRTAVCEICHREPVGGKIRESFCQEYLWFLDVFTVNHCVEVIFGLRLNCCDYRGVSMADIADAYARQQVQVDFASGIGNGGPA